MMIDIFNSESGTFEKVKSIGRVKYVGESFGVDSLTDGEVYDVIEVLSDDLIRVVDDSDEDYLYSRKNPRPLDQSSAGGKWVIVEDYEGKLSESSI